MPILGGRTRHCRWCGCAFTEMRDQRIYCSRKCERDARKSDKYADGDPLPGKLLQPEVRICKTCRKPFVTTHEGRKYCSGKCRFYPEEVKAEMEANGDVQEVLQKGELL